MLGLLSQKLKRRRHAGEMQQFQTKARTESDANPQTARLDYTPPPLNHTNEQLTWPRIFI